jgi:two-component system, OmpR family, osmolarity sensor histidine kinase EnvZ
VLLILSQVVSLKIFDYFEREPRAKSMAQEIITIVNFTKASIEAAAENKRIRLLSQLSGMGDVNIYPAYYFEPLEDIPNDQFLQSVTKKITQELPLGTMITVNHYDIPGIWVSFEIDSDLFWVVIPRKIIDRPFPLHWIGWGLIILGLAIAAAYLVTQRISRPLNRLIDGVDKIRFGQAIQRLPSDSVSEFNAVSEAFNEMSDNLEKINKNRRFLLASVSHDIRTPLTRLRLASEMLPEKSQETKDSMEQDISEINEIINQFLDFARGFEDEPITSVNLGRLLKETQLKHQRSGHNFKLKKTNIKADIPKKLFVDLRILAFKRCLDNLINNAFFYTKGEVKVLATLHEESFSISIIDEGPGIPEDKKKRLLEPFERVDIARGNSGGAGLGLTIADQIAKAHWGKLELINLEEGGLEAKLTIPLNLG